MNIRIDIDTRSVSDLADARQLLDLVARLGDVRASEPIDDTRPTNDIELARDAVDDLWKRLGAKAQELVSRSAEFNGPFTLAELAKRTGDDMSTIKSRWANLGRSLKQIHDLHAPIKVYAEYEETPEGWSFTMPNAVRLAIRGKTR